MLIISNAPPFEQYHNAQTIHRRAVYKRIDCIVNCSHLTYEQIYDSVISLKERMWRLRECFTIQERDEVIEHILSNNEVRSSPDELSRSLALDVNKQC